MRLTIKLLIQLPPLSQFFFISLASSSIARTSSFISIFCRSLPSASLLSFFSNSLPSFEVYSTPSSVLPPLTIICDLYPEVTTVFRGERHLPQYAPLSKVNQLKPRRCQNTRNTTAAMATAIATGTNTSITRGMETVPQSQNSATSGSGLAAGVGNTPEW